MQTGQWRLEQTPLLRSAFFSLKDTKVHVARGGHTGEDGFQVRPFFSFVYKSHAPLQDLLSAAQTDSIASDLVTGLIQWVGLGARDGLRREAGMCVRHDLDDPIGPVEAGPAWAIGKDCCEGEGANFIGAEHVLRTLKDGPKKRRIGLVVDGAPARGKLRSFPQYRARADRTL